MTSIEWLIQELVLENKVDLDTKMRDLMYKAAEMEKEQSKKDYEKGQESTKFKFPLTSDNYYNETYGGQDES